MKISEDKNAEVEAETEAVQTPEVTTMNIG